MIILQGRWRKFDRGKVRWRTSLQCWFCAWNVSDFYSNMYRDSGSKIFLGGLTWDITEGALLCVMILGSSDNVPS